MEGPPFGAFPWSAPGGTGQGSTDEIGDAMLGGVSGSMNLMLPSPAAQPPASPGGLVWNAPGVATERGEFAQGFLWFDAQPDYGGWPVKADSASAPLGGMLPPLPLPESFQQQQQQQQAFVPLDVLGQDTQQQQQQQQQLPITAGQPAAANGSRRGRGSGGDGRQAGGASRGAASEEERRARNRATQARFRERQKAKNEAALAEHAAAEAELERARQRQAMLRTHNSVLQNMLDAKDSMLGSLAAAAAPEAAAGVAALQPQPQQRLQLAAAEHAAGAQPPGQQQQQQQQRHEHRQPATDESNPPRPDGQAAAGGAAAAPATSAAGESSHHMGTDGEAGSGGGSGGGGQAGTAGGRPGGLSSSIQAHMEWLGRELTAQLAMLELPATADPDEAMALAHAQLAPMMEEAMPPRLKAHELLELQEHLANHQAAANAPANAPAASSGSGTPGAGGGSAAAAAPLQQQASTASTASGSAGGGDGGGPCASSLGASSERSGSGSQPVNLAELFRDKPDLVQHVMNMTAEELLEEWVNLARAFRSLLASYDAHRSAGDLEKILDIFRSWGGTLSLTLRLKPDNAQVLFATAGNAPPGTWEVAAGVLKPTPAQATMLRQLWHAYAGRAQTLRAERTAALQAVQTAAQQATACCGVGEAGTMAVASLPAVTLSGMTSQYLSLFDAAGKLSSLRDAEFITMLQLMGRVGAVFSPLQKARLVAACYPHFPDVVQVLRVLATGQVADGREQVSRWLS